MDSSQIKATTAVYWLGLTTPVLIWGGLGLLEYFGIKLGIGVPGIALVSLAICVVGLCAAEMTIKQRILMLLLAVCIIPVELLALAMFSLITGGLAGTQ